MRPTASYNIQMVTENVPISPAERGVWNKIMIKTANLKLKMTRKMTKLLLLQKLRRKGVGVNEVEQYARREVRRGAGGGGPGYREKRRREIVKMLMASKVRSAEVELEETKRQFHRMSDYLRRRWFQHREVMTRYNVILQEEVEREWEEKRRKDKEKINHLERKWVRARREEMRGGAGRDENLLEGIIYRDADLKRKAEEEGRDVDEPEAPLVYGGIHPTDQEVAALTLPPKFATFNKITEEEMEVEAEIMIAKLKWELRAREDRAARREEEGKEGGERWTEEWEEEQSKEREVYCEETGRMDFASRRVTDIPTCRRTVPPQSLPARETTILANLKSRLTEVTKTYISNKCDKNGNVKNNNITEDEAAGMKSVKKKVKEEEWVVMQTDKSKRLTANTKQNYLERLYKHTEGDVVVTMEEKNKIERELNATTLQLGRILNLGEKWNESGRHWPRIKNALRTKNCLVPPLYGLPKDHKAVPPGEGHLGPPLRPVCGAVECPNGALSGMLTEILTVVGDKAEDEDFNCLSNEELMAAFTEANQRNMKNPVVFSMDVQAMYPNLNVEKVAEVSASEFLKSGLQIDMDRKELGLYLAIVYQGERRKEIATLGLDTVIPRRKHPRARKVLISTDEVLSRTEGEIESKFLLPERQPTDAEVQLMFSLALREMIRVCMKSHTYSIGTDDRLQSGGGPIGLKLSGAVGRVFMGYWCRKFKEKLINATTSLVDFAIHLYKFYVDDHTLVTEALPPGARLVEGKVEVMEEEVEGDTLVPADERTARIVQDIANTVCQYTTMEVDYPSNHDDKWLPILDNRVRIEGGKIDWTFYKKPVDSKLFILNRSALSSKVKRATLAQEALRRLRNVRPDKLVERKGELLTEMAEGMKRSGYPEDYRKEVLEASIVGYKKQVTASEAGEKPLYRPRWWRKQERAKSKMLKKGSWYRPSDTVLFVPSTPQEELANKVKEIVGEESKRLNFKVKVVERGGMTMKQHLVRTDMGRTVPCAMGDCPICLTNPGEGGGLRHQRSGALYSGSCLICKALHGEEFEALYWGESGDSGYVRTKSHLDSVEKRDLNNAFAKHLQEHHPDRVGDKSAFQFRVAKTFRKPLERQISEAVKIHGCKASICLNSKAEWMLPATDRIVVTREPQAL